MKRLRIEFNEEGYCDVRIDDRLIGTIQSIDLSVPLSTIPKMVLLFPEVMENPTEQFIQDAIERFKPFPWVEIRRMDK